MTLWCALISVLCGLFRVADAYPKVVLVFLMLLMLIPALEIERRRWFRGSRSQTRS